MRIKTILVTGVLLLLAAIPAHANAQTEPGQGVPPKPVCYVWGGPGDCDNNGADSNLDLWGCSIDFEGNYRYAWTGAYFHGQTEATFLRPFRRSQEFWVHVQAPHWRAFDAGKIESAGLIIAAWSTIASHSWMNITYIECCDCKTDKQAADFAAQHIQQYYQRDDSRVDPE